MISLLKIINFQSWKKGVFHLHKGVNIFIGTSDSGKSSIIRGLDWAFNNNKPSSGDAFRSYWGGDTKVITLIDDHKLIRKKTATENLYILDKERFKAFGQGVPEEVEKLVNLSDINWQRQHDSPFLLSDTSGEVARFLNGVVHLDSIDSSLSSVGSSLRSLRGELETEEEEITELKESLKKYSYLEEMEEEVAELEKTRIERDGLALDVAVLSDLLDEMKSVKKKIKRSKAVLQMEDKVKALGKIEEEISELEEEREELHRIYEEITLTERHRADTAKTLSQMNKEWKKEMPDECPLCGRSG